MQTSGYSMVSGELSSGIRISKKPGARKSPCQLLALSGHLKDNAECPLTAKSGLMTSCAGFFADPNTAAEFATDY